MAPFHSVPSSLVVSVAADQWAAEKKEGGQPALALLSDSLYFLFNRNSPRDFLPAIYYSQKKFRYSIWWEIKDLGQV